MKFAFLCVLLTFTWHTYAQDSLLNRRYQFGIYNQFDLRNSSTNAITTHRILHDVFRKGIKPKMNERWGNITYGVYSFAATYMTMLWSHEFGHSLRAEQVGGNFKIHNGALPIPYTTMHLPNSISLVNEALSVTAGFEVNTMNMRSIQAEFVTQNGICNEDLAFSFANRLMYPLYSSVIVPRDPEKRDVWINTAGDPIHVALPVFKNYSDNQVFMADSTVNPALVRYYNQSSIFALLINLADPQLYREVGAAFGKKKSRAPIFILGDHTNGWTYGTCFNVSPLGYELYMNNYIHLGGQQFIVYLKYGNPFKNYGVGLTWNDLIKKEKLRLSATVDLWDQDLFGQGLSGELYTEIKAARKVGFFANVGYKTEGYVIGKQIAKGFNLGGGLVFYTSY